MCGRVAGGWALGGWGNCGGQGTNPASLYLHWGFWEGGRGYKLKVRMGDISMKQWKIVSGITWYEYQWWRGEGWGWWCWLRRPEWRLPPSCLLPSPPPNQHSVEDKPEFQKAPVTISAWLEPLSSWLPPALQPARLVLSCIDDVEPLQRTVWSGLVDHKKVEH